MAGDRQLAGGTLVPLLDAVIRLAPVPMVVSDRRGRFLAANHQWQVLQGETATEPQGWLDHLDALSRHRLLEDIERTAAAGNTSSIDLEMRMPPGCRWTRWWLQRREIDDEVVVVMAVIDVHDDVSQKDDLREMAIRDDLTGLLNRRFFHEAAEQALRRAERFSEAACVLYVDLDGFKSVNDQAGHHTGDQVLTAVAARLRQAVRAADVVGRIGGDEFAVLIERLPSPAEAAIVSRRVEEALNGSVEVDGEEWPLAASVGMAISRSGHDSADELMSRADQAMYLAKRSRTVATGPPETGDPPEERSGERPGERPEVPVER
ncbi:MAG TPA: GGDEF domain-containing protein, partial [Acidimicrobiales bacterium]|nr:GGDEF domain-containing protein [Acidimicrobiales bacterium]